MSKDALVGHEIIKDLKRVAADLGHAPGYTEYLKHGKFSERQFRKCFGGYTPALHAAGFREEVAKREMEKKFKYQPQRFDSFVIHNLNLKSLFKRAGNPEVLKFTEQPDTHCKHRDRKAVSCYFKFLDYFKPHGDIIMGDFIDVEDLSHWPSIDGEPRDFITEALEGRELLSEKNDILGKGCSTRIYLTGNHEDWINQFLASGSNPQLHRRLGELGINVNLRSLLALEQFGYDLIPLNEVLRIGRANFIHGFYCGDTHAKKHLSKIKGNIFYGHLHDGQSYDDVGMDGNVEAHSLYSLCKLDPKYLRGLPNRWGHGFGVHEFRRDGSYSFLRPRISDGKLSFNGKLFTGDNS